MTPEGNPMNVVYLPAPHAAVLGFSVGDLIFFGDCRVLALPPSARYVAKDETEPDSVKLPDGAAATAAPCGYGQMPQKE